MGRNLNQVSNGSSVAKLILRNVMVLDATVIQRNKCTRSGKPFLCKQLRLVPENHYRVLVWCMRLSLERKYSWFQFRIVFSGFIKGQTYISWACLSEAHKLEWNENFALLKIIWARIFTGPMWGEVKYTLPSI